ncbi:MAG: hypothetical protein IRZ21_07865 [Thermoleophilaceae bacterium]|nr:hypothetical protein [Thermoleophilaceae bacterium]
MSAIPELEQQLVAAAARLHRPRRRRRHTSAALALAVLLAGVGAAGAGTGVLQLGSERPAPSPGLDRLLFNFSRNLVASGSDPALGPWQMTAGPGIRGFCLAITFYRAGTPPDRGRSAESCGLTKLFYVGTSTVGRTYAAFGFAPPVAAAVRLEAREYSSEAAMLPGRRAFGRRYFFTLMPPHLGRVRFVWIDRAGRRHGPPIVLLDP